ncbi:MAG: LysR family transcriptional regulator [Leptolyngbya sp. SIO1D8]|nr:LysR family transcriptional regulator [Leptolyngbya sp. SIO1D8]
MLSIWTASSVTIDYANLRNLDLNLLLALDVLIEEASVTKAAEKLNMSQSTMSYALKRLRSLLDDPILIRTSRDMEVTPYAREISITIRQVLTDIQHTLLEKDAFDPNTARERFCIATSDYVEATLGGDLLQRLTDQAPGIRIRIRSIDRGAVLEALDHSEIDLFIGVNFPHKSWHVKQDLYEEAFVCVVNSDFAFNEISLEEYLKRSHILVSMRDDFQGAADQFLAQQQLARTVVWSTGHFMAIPFLIENSDHIALLPRRMAQKCAQSMGLRLLPPPINVTGFTVSMFWHQRNINLSQHQWLRQQLIEAAQKL